MRARATAGLALLVVAGCVATSSGPRGPVVSPTGIVYAPGTPPTSTRYSETASLYLRSANPERALNLVLEGIAADPENPIHYFIAGVASARLGLHERADALMDEAQRIYPAYELDAEPERLAAWVEAFNRGSEAYEDGLVEEAIEAWKGATLMYRLRPEAHRNLAALLQLEGRLEEAGEVYSDLLAGLRALPATRTLDREEVSARSAARGEAEERLAEIHLSTGRFAEAEPLLRARLVMEPDNRQVRQNLASVLVGQHRPDEARELYEGILSERGLGVSELHNLGVGLFRAGAPGRSAEAFWRIVEVRSESRDAWLNYANALLAAEDWERLIEAGDRLLWLDPLGEAAAMMVARAHLESGDEPAALARLERIDGAPVHLEGLVLRVAGALARIEGVVVGNAAPAGSVLHLRFTLQDDEGGEVSVDKEALAPAPGESHALEVSASLRATGFRYELRPPTPPR